MNFLARLFGGNNDSHTNDLRALIGEQKNLINEYKDIIEDLRQEIKGLKEELSQSQAKLEEIIIKDTHNISNEEIKPNTNPEIKKKLSKNEKKVFDTFMKVKPKDINELNKTLKFDMQHLRVYISKIKKKGYNINFP